MNSTRYQKLKNQISGPLGHFLISQRHDDLYIAAYPRSGSTWLRTILVNIMVPNAKSDPDIFNAKIPAVSIRNSKQINTLESPRQIMTHSTWRPSIERAVHLVRDGRDSLISSYHYHVTRNGRTTSMQEFFEQYNNRVYGDTWANHTQSWLVNGVEALSGNLLRIQFEDLKRDTEEVVQRVCEFIEIETNESQIERAVSDASLDNAKRIERQRHGELNNNASFYREGKTRQWQSEIYSELVQSFEKESGDALRLAGYSLSIQ